MMRADKVGRDTLLSQIVMILRKRIFPRADLKRLADRALAGSCRS